MFCADGICPSPEEIQAVRNWPVSPDLPSLQSFRGFLSYYQRFIDGFAEIAAPLKILQSKHAHSIWTSACQNAFEHLRDSLSCETVVKLFDPDLLARVEIDSFGLSICVLWTHGRLDG
jgi:hypothetical protein